MLRISALVLGLLLLNGCDRLTQLAHQPEIVQKQGEELNTIDGKIDNLEKRLSDFRSDYDEIKYIGSSGKRVPQ